MANFVVEHRHGDAREGARRDTVVAGAMNGEDDEGVQQQQPQKRAEEARSPQGARPTTAELSPRETAAGPTAAALPSSAASTASSVASTASPSSMRKKKHGGSADSIRDGAGAASTTSTTSSLASESSIHAGKHHNDHHQPEQQQQQQQQQQNDGAKISRGSNNSNNGGGGGGNGQAQGPGGPTGPNGRQEHTKEDLYKTELCRKWQQTGSCRYGDRCQFAHGLSELRALVRHPLYKTSMCKSFEATGECRYGNRCRFIHDEDEDYLNSLPRGVATLNITPADDPSFRRIPSAPANLDTYKQAQRPLAAHLFAQQQQQQQPQQAQQSQHAPQGPQRSNHAQQGQQQPQTHHHPHQLHPSYSQQSFQQQQQQQQRQSVPRVQSARVPLHQHPSLLLHQQQQQQSLQEYPGQADFSYGGRNERRVRYADGAHPGSPPQSHSSLSTGRSLRPNYDSISVNFEGIPTDDPIGSAAYIYRDELGPIGEGLPSSRSMMNMSMRHAESTTNLGGNSVGLGLPSNFQDFQQTIQRSPSQADLVRQQLSQFSGGGEDGMNSLFASGFAPHDASLIPVAGAGHSNSMHHYSPAGGEEPGSGPPSPTSPPRPRGAGSDAELRASASAVALSTLESPETRPRAAFPSSRVLSTAESMSTLNLPPTADAPGHVGMSRSASQPAFHQQEVNGFASGYGMPLQTRAEYHNSAYSPTFMQHSHPQSSSPEAVEHSGSSASFLSRPQSPNAYGRAHTSGVTLQQQHDDAFGRSPPRSMSMQYLAQQQQQQQQQQQPPLHHRGQHLQHPQVHHHQPPLHSTSMNALSSQMGGLGLGAQASSSYYGHAQHQQQQQDLDPIRKVASVNSLFSSGPFSASAHELQMHQQQAQLRRNEGFGFFQSVNSEMDRLGQDNGDGPAF